MSSPATLSADDVRGSLPEMKDLIERVERAFADVGNGSASEPAYTVAPDDEAGVLAIQKDGAVVARVDAEAFQAARAGATIAVAAKAVGDPDAEVITILGCDAAARCAIEALLCVYPYAERMLAFDPDVKRQEHFADDIMTSFDLASIIPPEPYEAVNGAQILITSMPAGSEPVIEPDWLQTGTLCFLLDGLASFTAATLGHVDRIITDDVARHDAAALAGMPSAGDELGAIVAGKASGRGDDNPTILIPSYGHPAVDSALAAAIVERA